MNIKIIAVLALSVGFAQFANAQAPTSSPQFALRTDLIPPSPNAASLGKYGVVPVSLQTGIPSISVPITEIKGKELSIPVTLNYHNNGFKPTEEASWVGLGWSLDAGGVITRIVRDKVDEFVDPLYNYDNTNWRYTTPDSVTRKFLDMAMHDNLVDTEPDVYTYNFAGYSGKFFIKNGTYYQYPYQQLTISRDASNNGFTIIAPDGTMYNFLTQEHTIAPHNPNFDPNNPPYVLPTDYVSSWYLTTVVSANYKDQITLNYSTPKQVDQRGPGTQSMAVSYLGAGIGTYTVQPIYFSFPTRIAAIQLTSITSSKMTVLFNANTPRADFNTPMLDSININNHLGVLVNKFKFNFGYYCDTVPASNKVALRLKLNSVEEGLLTANVKRHSFYYNGGLGSSEVTTTKRLPRVDHWGYSNGTYIESTGNMMPNTLYPYGGISKEPDMNYAKQAILSKVVYPTGGSSVMEYEQNVYNNGLNYVYNNLNNPDNIHRTDSTTTNTISSTTTFVINEAQMVHLFYYRHHKADYGPVVGPDDPTKNFTPDVTINPGNYTYTIQFFRDEAGKADSVFLQPGTYTMLLKSDNKENDMSANIQYRQKTNQVIEGKAGPGIRISRISDFNDAAATGSPVTVKEYVYKDSVGMSTGVLLNVPFYSAGTYREEHYTGSSIDEYMYYNYSATSSNGIQFTQDMYYKKVFEKRVSSAETLLGTSEFDVISPDPRNGSFVFLKRKTDFKLVNTKYKPVAKEEFGYSLVPTETAMIRAVVPHLSIRRIPTCGSTACGIEEKRLREYDFSDYVFVPSFLRLNSQRQVSYSKITETSPSDSIVTLSTFLYDNVVRNKTHAYFTDSKGITHIEKYKYRPDYTNVFAPGIASLIEKQTWLKRSAIDSVLTSGVITDYTDSAKPTTIYGLEISAPISAPNQETKNAQGYYTNLLSDSRYQARLKNTYNSSTANLVAQDLTGFSGSTTLHQVGYLWGYHNNYPIAQVKNAALQSVAYTSFEDDDASFTYTPAGIGTADARTGVKSYNGTISKSGLLTDNYVLTLWAKGTGSITVGGIAKTVTTEWQKYTWALNGITSLSFSSNGNLIDEVCLYPTTAQMSTYTYAPLTGVSSVTDQRGDTTFFDYDSLQRVVNVKDSNNKILKHYDYHYRGQ